MGNQFISPPSRYFWVDDDDDHDFPASRLVGYVFSFIARDTSNLHMHRLKRARQVQAAMPRHGTAVVHRVHVDLDRHCRWFDLPGEKVWPVWKKMFKKKKHVDVDYIDIWFIGYIQLYIYIIYVQLHLHFYNIYIYVCIIEFTFICTICGLGSSKYAWCVSNSCLLRWWFPSIFPSLFLSSFISLQFLGTESPHSWQIFRKDVNQIHLLL